LLRRRSSDGTDTTQLQIHDLHLDLLARRVSRAGDRLELTAKEFALLSLLARHKGEILSKMMIAEQVWDMNFDSDANVVEVAIKRLRAKVDAPTPLNCCIPFGAWDMSLKHGRRAPRNRASLC
jgi:two-component system copper resistance phosphate regulon response regulator CusR